MTLDLGRAIAHARRRGWLSSPQSSWLIRLWSIIATLSVVSCATKGQIRDLTLPLPVIKKVISENLPGGVRKESPNGRELTSDAFDPKDIDKSWDGKSVKAVARVTVLGTRRPYEILIVVERHQFDKRRGQFVALARDRALEAKIKARIQTGFAQRPNDLNVIDDFRAF